MTKPLVSYHTNTFNRVHMLKNMFDSFFECNVNESFEWVVTDYGSTDGTRDYLTALAKDNKWLKLHFGDQHEYFTELESMRKGFYPRTRRQVICAIFGKSKNDARALCTGDYYIDMPDDNQFIRKDDWVADMIDVFKHREELLGRNDLCSILYRSMFAYRIHKQNNERNPVEMTSSGSEYYVAKHKHYDDYHMMPAGVYAELGKFYQLDELASSNDVTQATVDWLNGDTTAEHSHYIRYMETARVANYSKAFMKYPYTIDFPNDIHAKLNVPHDGLIFPLVDLSELKRKHASQSYPVTTEQLITHRPGILETLA